MRRWGFQLAVVLICAMSALLPAMSLNEKDTYQPLGFSQQVWVKDAGPQATTAGLHEAVQAFAEARQVNVARARSASDDVLLERELFVAVGAPGEGAAGWLSSGYPAFSRNATTHVRPWDELDGETIPAATTSSRGPLTTRPGWHPSSTGVASRRNRSVTWARWRTCATLSWRKAVERR